MDLIEPFQSPYELRVNSVRSTIVLTVIFLIYYKNFHVQEFAQYEALTNGG